MFAKIISITYPNGEPRTDKKYPKWIGAVGEVALQSVMGDGASDILIFDDGDTVGFRTSLIQDSHIGDKGFFSVTTLNSIYTFQEVDKKE